MCGIGGKGVHYSLKQPPSADIAVDGPAPAPAKGTLGHLPKEGIAVPPAQVENELPAEEQGNCNVYGSTDDGGARTTVGADWASFRAIQLTTTSAPPWAQPPSDASAARSQNGTWFDSPLGVDSSNGVRTCTGSFGQDAGGSSGAADSRLIANPIRPATPPRMLRPDHDHDNGNSAGGGDSFGGGGVSATDRTYSVFHHGGEASVQLSDRGRAGSNIGQRGSRASVCGTILERTDGTESAQVGKTIAKKLDFHDVFLDPV